MNTPIQQLPKPLDYFKLESLIDSELSRTSKYSNAIDKRRLIFPGVGGFSYRVFPEETLVPRLAIGDYNSLPSLHLLKSKLENIDNYFQTVNQMGINFGCELLVFNQSLLGKPNNSLIPFDNLHDPIVRAVLGFKDVTSKKQVQKVIRLAAMIQPVSETLERSLANVCSNLADLFSSDLDGRLKEFKKSKHYRIKA